MSPRRNLTRDRRLLAVSVLSAGTIACSGSAAMVATASAAPATPRDVLPAAPVDPVTAVLALLSQLAATAAPLLELLDVGGAGLTNAIATLSDGQLGQLVTKLTGLQLASVFDGSAIGRLRSVLTTITTPELLNLAQTVGSALRGTLPDPVGITLDTVLTSVVGALSDRGVTVPPQIASLLAQPAVPVPAPAAPAAATSLRARIFDAAVARDRRSVRLDLTCPAVSDTACKVVVRTTVAGRRAGADRRLTISRGRSKVLRPRLTSAARKRLSTRGGTVKVTVRTTGSGRGPVSSAFRVPAPRGA